MRILEQPAYILHHRPFRDTSQIVDILTPDYGRLSLMSRGSRSAKSRQKSILQPFNSLILSWSGKGELPTLTSAEAQISNTTKLSGKALLSAFYVNELLVKLLHKHDVHDGIYYLYESILNLLAESTEIEPILRLFEKRLLEELGFGLNLTVHAETGEAVVASELYAYYLEHGPIDVASVHDEQYVTQISGASLLALNENSLDTEQALKDAKRLMRSILNFYLQGKKIKSRELFR